MSERFSNDPEEKKEEPAGDELQVFIDGKPAERWTAINDDSTCSHCGGKDWHHSVDCYLGRD